LREFDNQPENVTAQVQGDTGILPVPAGAAANRLEACFTLSAGRRPEQSPENKTGQRRLRNAGRFGQNTLSDWPGLRVRLSPCGRFLGCFGVGRRNRSGRLLGCGETGLELGILLLQLRDLLRGASGDGNLIASRSQFALEFANHDRVGTRRLLEVTNASLEGAELGGEILVLLLEVSSMGGSFATRFGLGASRSEIRAELLQFGGLRGGGGSLLLGRVQFRGEIGIRPLEVSDLLAGFAGVSGFFAGCGEVAAELLDVRRLGPHRRGFLFSGGELRLEFGIVKLEIGQLVGLRPRSSDLLARGSEILLEFADDDGIGTRRLFQVTDAGVGGAELGGEILVRCEPQQRPRGVS
jgi:hypothetical protein